MKNKLPNLKKKILKTSLFVAISSAVVTIIIGVWIYSSFNTKKGFSTNYINRYVVEKFNSENKHVKIDLKNIRLKLLSDSSILGLHAKKILVYKDKKVFAQFDNVKISFSLWNMIFGKFPVKRIDVNGVKVIYHNKQSIINNINYLRTTIKNVFGLSKVVFESIYELQNINISDIDLQYSDDSGMLVAYRSGSINITKGEKRLESKFLGSLNIQTPNKKTIKIGLVSYESELYFGDKDLYVDMNFKGIDNLIDMSLQGDYDLNNHKMSGELGVSLQDRKTLNLLGFNLPSDLDLGTFLFNLKTEKYDLNSGGNVKITGQMEETKINGSFLSVGRTAKFDFFIKDIDEKILKKYCPDDVAKETCDWMLKNIIGTYDLNAKFDMNIDTYKMKNHTGKIYLKDAIVDYYSGLPPMQVKKASADYTENKLNITIQDGFINANNEKLFIDGAKINIFENGSETMLDFKTDTKMKVKTALWWLNHKEIQFTLPDKDLNKLSGIASGKLNLEFNLTKEELSNYSYNGFVKNVRLPKIKQFKNISSDNIKLIVLPVVMTVSGNAKFNDNSKGSLIYEYKQDQNKHLINDSGYIDNKTLNSYIKKDIVKFDNKIKIDLAYILDKNENENIVIKSDLSKSIFEIIPLQWKKKYINKSNIRIDLNNNKNKNYNVSVKFKSDSKIPLNINFKMGGDKNGIRYIKTNKVKYGDGYVDIDASRKKGFLTGYVKGNNLYSEILNKSISYLPETDEWQKYSLDIDMLNIKTFDGHLGARLWGKIKNNGKSFDLISLRSNMIQPKSRMLLFYNKKQLRLYSNHLSSTYNMFFVNSPVKGGVIGVVGDADENGVIQGKLTVRDIVVQDVPESTRILKIFSVVGIFDSLQTKNLEFNKIGGRFTLQDGIYSSKNISAIGKTIAVSAKGKIDTNKKFLELKGMILPSYKLGSVFKNIPILGVIISGVDSQGPIVQRYHAKGGFDDYEVKIDNLGLFTLGILRNVFATLLSENEDVPVKFD